MNKKNLQENITHTYTHIESREGERTLLIFYSSRRHFQSLDLRPVHWNSQTTTLLLLLIQYLWTGRVFCLGFIILYASWAYLLFIGVGRPLSTLSLCSGPNPSPSLNLRIFLLIYFRFTKVVVVRAFYFSKHISQNFMCQNGS